MKSLHCIVKGKVQGGNFQGWLQKEAEDLGVTGWVRNIVEGEAEIIAQADDSKLAEFEERIRNKAPLPEVEEIKTERIEYEKTYDSFAMRG